jgi:hypothetical protein
VALLSLRPWATDSVIPQLSVSPGIGIALGDSVVVAPARGVDVAGADVAAVRQATFVVEPAAGGERGSVPELAVARARPVTRPLNVPVRPPRPTPSQPPSQPQPTPVSLPAPAPVSGSSPESSPVPPSSVATSYGSIPLGPIGAGVGNGSTADASEVCQGDEYALSFSFSAQPTAYRMPGSDNLIMQLRSEAGERPSFGLQLWDDGSERGLWSSGDAMGDERLLAPVVDTARHDVVVDFRASSEGDGFYLVFLDGQPIDLGAGVSLIDPGSSCTQIEVGLFRDGEPVQGSAEVIVDSVRLGDALESAQP